MTGGCTLKSVMTSSFAQVETPPSHTRDQSTLILISPIIIFRLGFAIHQNSISAPTDCDNLILFVCTKYSMVLTLVLLKSLIILIACRTCFGYRQPSQIIFRPQFITRKESSLGMFGKLFRVVVANINSVIRKVEDPEKLIEQAVEEMQNDYIKIRQSYAEVMATQKRMEAKKSQSDNLSMEWYKRAQLALKNNEEELAREALTRRKFQQDLSESISRQLVVQNELTDKLYTSMNTLEAKIAEAKRQKEAFISRARTAQTSAQVSDMLSGLSGSGAMEVFERMKEKVEMLEARAEIASSNTGGTATGLEESFALLESKSAVDLEMEQLRRDMRGDHTGGSKVKLPAIDAEFDGESRRRDRD